VFGLLQPRGGAGPLITAAAGLLAQMIRTQERLDHPLADDLGRLRPPSARMLVGVSETMRQIRAAQLVLPAIERVARLRGHTVPAPPIVPPAPDAAVADDGGGSVVALRRVA
jgi:hypothetical protein